jgi:hypothetical protein
VTLKNLLPLTLIVFMIPRAHSVQPDPHLSELPTYFELMSLSPAKRIEYMNHIREILVAAADAGNGVANALIADTDEPSSPIELRGILALMAGWIPEAYAAGWFNQSINQIRTWDAGSLNSPQYYSEKCTALVTRGGTQRCANWQSLGRTDSKGTPLASAQQPNVGPFKPGSNSNSKANPDGSVPQANGTNAIDKDESKDIPKIDPKQQSATEMDCSKVDPKAMDNFRKKKELSNCVYAGNMSEYTSPDRKAGTCKKVTSYCLSSAKPCPDEQNIKCPSGQAACNPLVFGLDTSGGAQSSGGKAGAAGKSAGNSKSGTDKPNLYCVPASGAAITDACDKKAPKNKDSLGLLGGAIHDNWKDFSEGFNMLCNDEVGKASHCSECKTIATRLKALNANYFKGGSGNVLEITPPGTSSK